MKSGLPKSLSRLREFVPARVRRSIPIILFFAVAALVCDIAIPWVLKGVLEAQKASLSVLFAIVTLGALRTVAALIQARLNGSLVAETVSSLNKKMARSCLDRSPSAAAAETVNVYSESVRVIEQFLDSVLWQTVAQALYCTGAFFIAYYLAGPIVLVAMVPVLLAISFSGLFKKRLQNAIHELLSQKGKMGELLQDLIEGREIVRTYQAEIQALSRFDKSENEALTERRKAFVLLGLFVPVFEAIGLVSIVAVLFVGYSVLSKSPTGMASAVTAVVYLAFVARALLGLAPILPMWNRFKVAMDRLAELFAGIQNISMGKTTKGDVAKIAIVISDLSFGYRPGKKVFDGLGVRIGANAVTALVGPNGAGKSTLLKILAGELQPQLGNVAFDGVNWIPSQSIAYLPQEPFLFRTTILENLRLVEPGVTEEEIWSLANELGFADFLEKRGLDTPVGGRGSSLSGGERQKLSLLRFALRARHADICLLDEPTSYIDIQSEEALMDVVLKRCRQKTTIVASHRPWLIQACDKTIELGRMDH